MQYGVRYFFIPLISALLIYFSAGVANAEIGVGFPKPATQGSAMLSQANPTVSPNDFKNRVRNLGKQNRDQLTQDVKQELSQQPKTGASTTSTEKPGTGTLEQPVQAQPAPVPGTPAFTEPQTAVLPAPTFAPSAPGASPPAGGPIQTPPPANNGSVYTGFGSGTGTPPPASGTSGGWNIKY